MTTWSVELKVRFLSRLRWTIVPDKDEDGILVVRVAELPGLIAAGMNEKELSRAFHEALDAYLESVVSGGGEPLRPGHSPAMPWDEGAEVWAPTFVRVEPVALPSSPAVEESDLFSVENGAVLALG